ncbi:hypothetical protein GCM10011344_06260 [Dokdonia pacifica]|uniref:Por secretion system C-terminal sorting domain-containing protein n=1 Tax=Dokdonia pacifica TaxID=1627892 RepID=A0A238ZUQ9_9FLAO|nr:DUF1028 domain-containing protein [Dokdonia pacifica]GGG08451.1 hypothetical protein GCM10011344_06260 [Dokdonia pacifica]SNR86514.1 Por secretion system C-terminal sorting domain-containing protein [Dokdonia pacifica]
MKKNYSVLIALFFSLIIHAQDTFSIIAVDPATGEVGSAGASCVDGIGQFGGLIDIITDIIPGRGGVNSQAFVCIPNSNLANAIEQMEAGLSPDEIIDYLINNDDCSSQNFNPEFRQYGIADFDPDGNPRTAGFTGSLADDFKDDRQGATYSVQGNILLNETVLINMENNFNNTEGTLADKLMAAMQGANFAGADMRCLGRGTSSTSAYLVVYQETDAPGDPSLELNIEEVPFGQEPIDSLQILYDNALSIQDNTLKNNVKVFPNPVSDQFQVVLPPTTFIAKLEVFDLSGKRVHLQTQFSGANTGEIIDSSSYQKGVYFLRITGANEIHTIKIIKN